MNKTHVPQENPDTGSHELGVMQHCSVLPAAERDRSTIVSKGWLHFFLLCLEAIYGTHMVTLATPTAVNSKAHPQRPKEMRSPVEGMSLRVCHRITTCLDFQHFKNTFFSGTTWCSV